MAPRLSLHVRAKIVNYKYTLRLNHSAIARKLCSEGTKVSRRAVYSILKRYRETKSFRDAYRKPRRRVLNEAELNAINEWTSVNREISAKDIKNRIISVFKVKVSLSTVRRALKVNHSNSAIVINKTNKPLPTLNSNIQLQINQSQKPSLQQIASTTDTDEQNFTINNDFNFLNTPENTANQNNQSNDICSNFSQIISQNQENRLIIKSIECISQSIQMLAEAVTTLNNSVRMLSEKIDKKNFNNLTSSEANSEYVDSLLPTMPTTSNNESNIASKLSFKLSQDEIRSIYNESASDTHFALKLCRRLFTIEELKNRNVYGRSNKKTITKGALDAKRIEYIKELCLNHGKYNDSKNFWTECVEAINKGILAQNKKTNQTTAKS